MPRGPRQASPRVLAIAAAVVILAGVGIGLGVALGGSKGSSNQWPTTAGPVANGLQGAAQVQSLFNGIPQHGLTLGKPSAPVTITEYIDLQCPYCDEFETQVIPDFVPRFVRTGKVKLVMRPLAFIGPASVLGRKALIAASYQNKAFNFAEILYDNQRTENTGWLNDAMIESAAESIPGINPLKVDQQRNLASATQAAAASDNAATQDKVNSTPTLFIQSASKPYSQVPIASPTDEATLISSVNAALPKK